MNPFHYGKIVTGKDFCPRDEVAQVRSAIEKDQDLFLSGKPKVGKTSLVRHVFEDYKDQYNLIHVDLKLIETLADVERRIVLALMSSEAKMSSFQQVLVKYNKYSPTIGVDSTTEDITFAVPSRTGVTATSVIDLLRSYVKELNGKVPFLFLDNVQDLLLLEDSEFIPLLAEYIGSSNKTRFVLVEALDLFEDRKALSSDFENEKFQKVFVEPIPGQKYSAFVQEKFLEHGCILKEDLLERINAVAGTLTADRQHLAYSLWEVKGDKISLESVDLAKSLKNIFDKHKEFFDVIFEELTPLQRKVVKILSQDKEAKIYSRQFTEKVGPVAGNTVVKVVAALVKRRIVYKEGPYYRFSNPFFREWVNKTFVA